MTAAYRERFRYLGEGRSSKWLEFGEGLWSECGTVKHSVLRICQRVQAAVRADPETSTARLKKLDELTSNGKVVSVMGLMQGSPEFYVRAGEFDRHATLTNAPAGVFDEAGTLMPHRAALLMRKQLAFTPDASMATPEWDRFLMQVQGGDREAIEFLQRWCGYCLRGKKGEQKFIFLHGPTRSGKTTFLETLLVVMGSYAHKAQMDSFTKTRGQERPSWDLHAMRGSRVVIASETPQNARWDEQRLKTLTGGERVRTRAMFQESDESEVTYALTLAGNDLPHFTSPDPAVRARMIIMPFPHTTKKEYIDLQLPEKLLAEGPGIATWIQKGLFSYLRGGLRVPDRLEKVVDAYFAEEDRLGQWLQERCEFGVETRQISFRSELRGLYSDYRQWCEEAGVMPKHRSQFGKEVLERVELGLKRTFDAKSRLPVYIGIKLSGHLDFDNVVSMEKHKETLETMTSKTSKTSSESDEPEDLPKT